MLLYLVPSIGLALLASACVGLSNGTANPAGSEVLTRLTPREHRNLVFSIKQAGVPLGGMLGGLAIPPLIEAMGWRYAAVVVAAVCIVATLATWPFQSKIDLPPDKRVAPTGFRLTDILVPMRSLSHGDRLWRASWVGGLLAIPQAAWITFLVTYLVVVLGQTLSVAGLMFAVMQLTSMAGSPITSCRARGHLRSPRSARRSAPSCWASAQQPGLSGRSCCLPQSPGFRFRPGTASRSPKWHAALRLS
jgi:MFS family permease